MIHKAVGRDTDLAGRQGGHREQESGDCPWHSGAAGLGARSGIGGLSTSGCRSSGGSGVASSPGCLRFQSETQEIPKCRHSNIPIKPAMATKMDDPGKLICKIKWDMVSDMTAF